MKDFTNSVIELIYKELGIQVKDILADFRNDIERTSGGQTTENGEYYITIEQFNLILNSIEAEFR